MTITLIRQETISLGFSKHSFRPLSEGRLTFKGISSTVIRAKRVKFLQPTVHRIHSLGKSKALAVPERSQKCLLNNRKYMRQETMTVASINILYLVDSELIFWIRSNILFSAFFRSGYEALLSRIYLHLRPRVWVRMSYELVQLQVSWPMNKMSWETENTSTPDATGSMNDWERT